MDKRLSKYKEVSLKRVEEKELKCGVKAVGISFIPNEFLKEYINDGEEIDI